MKKKAVLFEGDVMNTQAAVRAVLMGLGEASLFQIRAALNLTDDSGRSRVYGAIESLARSGEAVRVRQGVYKYHQPVLIPPVKLGKIWRAIRVQKRFTVSELELFSGADTSYIQRFVKWLQKEEYITDTGKRKKLEKLYNVTSKATPACPAFTQKVSVVKTEKREQLETLTFELLRFVLKKDKKLAKKINEIAHKIVNLTGGKR